MMLSFMLVTIIPKHLIHGSSTLVVKDVGGSREQEYDMMSQIASPACLVFVFQICDPFPKKKYVQYGRYREW